ncbi:MAG: molybdate ABC transporter substrate-binding protein [Rhodoglobus sp.]
MKRVAILVAAVLVLAGCSAQPATTETPTPDPVALTVYAAASLTDSFADIATAFEKENPGVTVSFNFGGSSALATQIVAGSPGDVFAAASPATMKTVTDAALTASDPVVFVTNTLELVVPTGNPAGVTGLADLANPNLTIALCAAEVPCGAAAVTLLAQEGVTAAPDTLEQDVKAVLTKVELGEVDAALVYKTDVESAGDKVDGIEVPGAEKVVNQYPIAALSSSENPAVAQAFVDFVLGKSGQTILAKAGFGAPN